MKLNVIAAVLLCITTVAVAQAPPNPTPDGPGAQRHLERLAVLLDLTDAQKAQVKAILDKMRAAHEQLKTDEIQQLSAVLTAAQLKKFEVLHAEERPPRFHGPRGGDPGPASN
jgi:Spy/CpxP family protein refolding chaperone